MSVAADGLTEANLNFLPKGENANRVRPPAPKIGDPRQRVADFTYSLFTIHSSLKITADFWKVISNSE